MFQIIVSLLFLVLQVIDGQQVYRATIDMAGYKGTVQFEPMGNDMTITPNISGRSGTSSLTNFSITTLPAIFGQLNNANEVCSSLGSTLSTFSGVSNGTANVVTSLSGSNIFNRGLLVRSADGATRVCATILPVDTTVITLKATFVGPIVGEVWIRGISGSQGFLVISNLAYSTPVGSNPNETTAASFYSYGSGTIDDSAFASRCSGLNSGLTVSSLLVGNSFSATEKRVATFIETSSISMFGNFVGVVDSQNNMRACAYLDRVESKTVVARISWDDVRATITMFQNSPFEFTTTTVNATGLRSGVPAGYHIHKFPVPQRLDRNEQRCSDPNVGGHFNPYGVVVADSPANGTGTSDEYEIGDLSGKYGPLTTDAFNGEYVDWNLQLFGVNSVVGRSIVIHDSTTDRWVCASIEYPSTVATAIVRFNYPAYGFMLFRQETNKPRSDVTVFGELANLNRRETTSHNFHIHQYPVHEDCTSAGPHYDPASLMENPDYMNACSPANPFQCEIGDLSLRHEGINIGSQLGQSNQFFFTDSYFSLSGPFNVIGRSIVVHDPAAAAPRYACNNITRVHTTIVSNSENIWKGNDADGTVTGDISFSQVTEYDRAVVTSDVTGLNNVAKTYHIHELPVNTESIGLDRCQANSVKGHFNPFEAEILTPATYTFDKYEVGDLSGKYGTITGANTISLSGIEDNNLPFTTGIVSCAGRSVVIHRNDDEGSRWKCNTIDLQRGDESGYVVTARAAFTTSNQVTGFVDLRQVVYEDGFSSVTTLLVSLFNNNFIPTPNHNWHIHINPVLDQSACTPALGHYDPYKTVTTSPNYTLSCNPRNPLGCEVGDISGKQSQYSINSQRQLYIDEDVPLHGNRTVLGRSIVFHEANGGPGRIACANIIPRENSYTLAFPSSVEYDYYRFTSSVAAALRIARGRVIVLHNVEIPVPGKNCSRVLITIAGTVEQRRVDDMLMGNSDELSPYSPSSQCKSQNNIDILGLPYYESGASYIKQNSLLLLAFNFILLLIQRIMN